MPSVDNRVVNMEFNSSTFESKIASTMKALEALEKSLKLQGAAKGLQDVDAAGKKVDLSHIGDGVEGISKKFLALSAVAITALANITNRAVNAGINIAKSFSFQPALDGFHEYELNVGAIQTILANTSRYGTNLQQVTTNLDQLNQYADKTIYSFGEMVRNIGLFTNAGIRIEDATSMIKGFSNEAAASGTNAEQAAGAAYQLSQALSSGTIRLMDWRSLTNAGMGNANMKQGLIDIANAMGTVSKAGISTNDIQKDFNASLEKGWLSADVMSNFLKIMAGDMTVAQMKTLGLNDAQIKTFQEQQKMAEDAATKVRTFTQLVGTAKEAMGSGWSETFRIVIGNFDEATNLWSTLSKTIGNFVGHSADVRNWNLTVFKNMGGVLHIIHGVEAAFHDVVAVLRPVKEAFRSIFPASGPAQWAAMAKAFDSFMTRLRPSVATISHIRSAFSGLFSVLSIGWTILKEGVGFVAGFVKSLLGLGGVGSGKILGFFANLGDSITKLQRVLVQEGGIARFFDNLTKNADKVIPILQRARDAIVHFFEHMFDSFKSDGIKKVSDDVERVGQRFDGLKNILSRVPGFFKPVLGVLGAIGLAVVKVLEAVGNFGKEFVNRIKANMGPGDFNDLLDSINTGLLGAITLLIAKWLKGGIKFDVGEGMFKSVKESFDALTGTLTAMQTQVKAEALKKIAIAVGILTASVVALSLIDSGALTKALTAMSVGFGQLLGAFAIINAMNSDAKSAAKFAAIAAGLNLLATSMVALSLAVAILAQLKWEDLMKGLGGVLTLLVGVTLISGPLSEAGLGLVGAGIGITALAVGLNILAGAVKLFSMMSYEDLGKGIGSIILGLVGINLAMQSMPATLPLTALGLLGVAVAMNILAGAVKIFATMSWEDLGKGAAALAGGLVLIAAGMNLMPITLPITAAGLILVANALVIMGAAMKIFATMDWGEIGKSLAVLAGSMLILTLAMNGMSGAAGGAVALWIMIAALGGLQKVLQSFADMSWGDIAHGLAAVTVSLLALGLLSSIMILFTPALLAMGVALGVVSAAFLVFGAGALLTATAFKIFADTGEKGAKAFLATMAAMGQALPQIFVGLAKGIINFILEIAKGIPQLVVVVGTLLDQLLDLFIKEIPKLVVVADQMFQAFINLGYTKGPQLIALGIFLLVTLLQGLNSAMPFLAQAVIGIIITFLNTISANMNQIIDSGVGVLLAFLQGIDDNLGKVINKGGDVIAHLVAGVIGQYEKVVTAAGDAIVHFITGLDNKIQDIITAGKNLVIHMIQGIGNASLEIANAAADTIVKFVNGLAAAIDSHSGELRAAGGRLALAIADGLTGGLASKAGEIADKAGSVVQGALDRAKGILHIGSPSKVTTQYGEWFSEGLSRGLQNGGQDVISAAEEIVAKALTTFGDMSKVADSLAELEDFQPTITPVLDLSQVQADASKISDLIGKTPKLVPAISTGQAQAIATTTKPTKPVDTEPKAPAEGGVRFEQTINAPTPLSTSDVYKQTRNLIKFAKEELSIP
jgi:tape measure domain-containing protein